MRVFINTIFILAFVMILATGVYPCSCEFWSPGKTLRLANAVFIGEAVEIGSNDKSAAFPVAIKFKVERYWKGVRKEFITVMTAPLACCTCALDAKVGTKYLIYAFKTGDGQLDTSLCASRRYDLAADELKIIGKGRKLKTKS